VLEALEEPFGTSQKVLSARLYAETREQMKRNPDEDGEKQGAMAKVVHLAQARAQGINVEWDELKKGQ